MSAQALRVLLVEDDRVDRAAVRRALSRRKAKVEIELAEAGDIRSAVELHAAGGFDCALVDYELPDGTALELIPQLVSPPGRVLPVVVLTGHASETFALEALKRGAQDYLTKDELDTRTLMRAIRYAIERAQVGRLQQHLERAERLVSIAQLAAGIAHEVNNPASYVLNSLELIDMHVSDLRAAPGLGECAAPQLEECAELVAAGLEGMQRIRSLTASLRNFARIDHHELEELGHEELVEAACGMLRAKLEQRARLVVELELLPRLVADRGRLVQVVTNLLLNALEAIEPGAPEQHEIRIRSSAEAGGIRLSIEDTGVGMDEELLARVFEPFFTTKARATGLGLPLCLDIVRKHGGELRVHSQPGEGTRVDLLLPLGRAC